MFDLNSIQAQLSGLRFGFSKSKKYEIQTQLSKLDLKSKNMNLYLKLIHLNGLKIYSNHYSLNFKI